MLEFAACRTSALRRALLAVLLIPVAIWTGCGGSPGGTQPPLVPSFTLLLSPANPTVASGSSTTVSITIIPQNGFSDTVSVQITGLPASATVSPAAPFTVPPSGLQVTIHAANSASPGTYALTFSGSSNTLHSSAAMSLQVAPPSVSLDSLIVNRLLYDPGRHRLYASVPDRAGANGNTVAVIDPAMKIVEQFIPVGTDPNALAMTDDGQFLYVGIDASGEIQRVNLATRIAELRFTLGGASAHGSWSAATIAPLPNQPHSVAVSLRYLELSTGEAGVAVYDDGIRRPDIALAYDNSIAFSASGTLYGFGEGMLYTMAVDPTGVSTVRNGQSNFADTANPEMLISNGRIYLSNGVVLEDPPINLAGTFAGGDSRGMAVDPVAGRTYLLRDYYKVSASIFAFDNSTFRLMGSLDLPFPPGEGYSLVQCGSAGFALATSTGVLITNTALTPPPVIGSYAGSVPATHLIHDPVRDKIYATVPGIAGPLGNSVVIIDPYSQTIESSIYVGSEPDEMGLSFDANALFVTLTGSRKIAKVDLVAQTIQYWFPLGPSPLDAAPMIPTSVAVSPDNNDVVAVSRYGFFFCTPVAIYDHGVALANVSPGFGCVSSVLFGASGSVLYGYTDGAPPTFFRMQVDTTGITANTEFDSLLSGDYLVSNPNMERLHYSQGILYSTRGAALDPAGPTVIGTFVMPFPPVATIPTSVVPDASSGQVYFLTYGPQAPPINVVRFDAQSFALLGTTPVNGSLYVGYDLVRFGSSGVAFATNDHRIIFVDLSQP